MLKLRPIRTEADYRVALTLKTFQLKDKLMIGLATKEELDGIADLFRPMLLNIMSC